MKNVYTKKEVIDLLESQKDICCNHAKVESHEYVNPYSSSDGEITWSVDKKSILDAPLALNK